MKKTLIWILAITLTLSAAIYQRLTGPTHPLNTSVDTGRQKLNFSFPRSHAGTTDCPIVLEIADITIAGSIEYRKFPGIDTLTVIPLDRQGDKLLAALPNQPMAGKLQYQVKLNRQGAELPLDNPEPIVIRFRGDVPAKIIIPHIILMFLAMLFSNVAGMYALFKVPAKAMTYLTVAALFAGGIILGPLVQKYAFNEYWAGIPFGWDLTDNKTLIAFAIWLLAVWFNRKENRPLWIIFAALATIVVFSIPHSLYGSELDHQSGKIVQGFVVLLGATICRDDASYN